MDQLEPQKETRTCYREHVCCYLLVNDVMKETKQKLIILDVVGYETYGLIHDLLEPRSPEMVTR